MTAPGSNRRRRPSSAAKARRWSVAGVAWAVGGLIALAVTVLIAPPWRFEFPRSVWCEKPVPVGTAPGAPLMPFPAPRLSPDGDELAFGDRCWWIRDARGEPLLMVTEKSRGMAAVRALVGAEPMGGVDANYALAPETRVVGGLTWVRLERTFPP